MAYYDNIYVQHVDPYTPAEMRFLGAREAKGFLQRMRQRDTSTIFGIRRYR